MKFEDEAVPLLLKILEKPQKIINAKTIFSKNITRRDNMGASPQFLGKFSSGSSANSNFCNLQFRIWIIR